MIHTCSKLEMNVLFLVVKSEVYFLTRSTCWSVGTVNLKDKSKYVNKNMTQCIPTLLALFKCS